MTDRHSHSISPDAEETGLAIIGGMRHSHLFDVGADSTRVTDGHDHRLPEVPDVYLHSSTGPARGQR